MLVEDSDGSLVIVLLDKHVDQLSTLQEMSNVLTL